MNALFFTVAGLCSYTMSGIRQAFAENNLTFSQTVSYHEDEIVTDEIIDGHLRRLKQTSRGSGHLIGIFQTLLWLNFKIMKRMCHLMRDMCSA